MSFRVILLLFTNKGDRRSHCIPGGSREWPEGSQGPLAVLIDQESQAPLPLFPYSGSTSCLTRKG